MSGRLKAFALLTLALVRMFFRRVFLRRRGLAAFRDNYDADGLPPVEPAERQHFSAFSRCIACGLCDEGEAGRMLASAGVYPGLMQLTLAASRSMPDYRAAAVSFAWVPDAVLEQKEALCPVDVPFRELSRFVRRKAEQVGGALPAAEPLDSTAGSEASQPQP
jgi:hypothetical protein